MSLSGQGRNTRNVLKAGVHTLPSSRTNAGFLKTSVCITPAFTRDHRISGLSLLNCTFGSLLNSII